MNTNKELDLAWQFVNHTDRTIFLTGKAGTGKTTFLHKLKSDSLKRLVVVAPTGVAAINAKGVTIHSFFQLPFGPILPNTTIHNSSNFKYRFSKTKIDLIRSLDLLVIDEISMVRCDVLDGIDAVLRRYRDRQKPFGGVQLLMIGDLQQLSPVVNDREWHLLKAFYSTAYFFSSQAFQQSEALTVELQHIYRQDNPKFIAILNEIRHNKLSLQSADELNKHYDPDFTPAEHEGYISLTTHNKKADQINQLELKKLKSKALTYKAKIKDVFPESSFPNDFELELKVGAQVMFIKNDSSVEKRYYNGKIGKVVWLSEDEISVQCPDDEHPISVTLETWENIKYSIDQTTKDVTEDLIGSYSQMPLRLAWSITIHKSQGLTFERAIIDAEAAFAHGQTYVALSRCKSLEGLVLKSKISADQIINDRQVTDFNEKSANSQVNDEELHTSKIKFQTHLIADVFNYFSLMAPVNRLLDVFYKNRTRIMGTIETPTLEIKTELTNLLQVASAFNAQIHQLANTELPEDSQTVQQRFTKAIQYFRAQHHERLLKPYTSIKFNTDNAAVEKDLLKSYHSIEEILKIKSVYFDALKNGFSAQEFLKLRAKVLLESKTTTDKKSKPKTVVDDVAHPKLFELLRELRNHIAQRDDLIHYQVFTQKSLFDMCEKLPQNSYQLSKINGMGKVRVEKYGDAILEIIEEYLNDHDVEAVYATKGEETLTTIKTPKIDTKEQSLNLFKLGKTIEDIAQERSLNKNTIFGHLAYYIPTGEIETTDLISKAHFDELMERIPKTTFESLSDLKHQFDDKYSYGELKIVLDELGAL